MDAKRPLVHVHAAPNSSGQFIFREQFPVRLHQLGNDFECAAAERDRRPVRTQFASRKVDLPPVGGVHSALVSLNRQHGLQAPDKF